MLGGNPLGDRFGFRYWKEPGAFAEYYKTGDTGKFLAFLSAFITASFTIAGPDYVSMAAGETINPRIVLPKAFNGVFYRLTAFFVLGVLCVGILVPYNDKEMASAFDNDKPGAAASPYVISMDRLHIPVLPHIVNAVVLTASFSAGNSYVYCASRSLYGLALERKAPRFLTKCTQQGVPIYCVAVVLLIALLSFLQVSNGASVVLNWFVNLVRINPIANVAPEQLLKQLRSLPPNSSTFLSSPSPTSVSRKHSKSKGSPGIIYHTRVGSSPTLPTSPAPPLRSWLLSVATRFFCPANGRFLLSSSHIP